MYKIIFFSLLLFIDLQGQYYHKIDSLFVVLENTAEEEREPLRNELGSYIFLSSPDSAQKVKEYIIKKAENVDKDIQLILRISHIQEIPYTGQKKLIKQVINESLELKKYAIAGNAYLSLAHCAKDSYESDSAMTYTLKAKELLENYGTKVDKRKVKQIIADLFYQSGEIDKAEKIYEEILSEKFDDVVNNNLALIAIKKGNYKKAKDIFLKNVNKLIKNHTHRSDLVSLGYFYRKLAEICILQINYVEAEEFVNKGIAISNEFKINFELVGLYTWKADILFENSEIDSALFYLKKAEELEKSYPDFKSKIDLYSNYIKVFENTKKYKEANKYSRLLFLTKSKSDSLNSSNRLTNAYSEYNFKNLLSAKNHEEREKNLYLAALIITILFSSILLAVFTKLIRSKRIIVNKNVQLSNSDAIFSNQVQVKSVKLDKSDYPNYELPKEESDKKEIDQNIIDDLIIRLEPLLFNEKIYLDSQLTVGKLSERLETNRTYLLKALQKKYNSNFVSFINGLRIKEAVKIMSSKESKTLNMEGIASRSGFNNRITFANVFKQITGVTPSFFIKNMDKVNKP